jgi:polyvinyl alcohol dehydrogenase (cytochrome)
MRRCTSVSLTLLITCVLQPVFPQAPDGETLFQTHCAMCHVNPTDAAIPDRAKLAALTPNAVVESLASGTMRVQGELLSAAERAALAEALTGRRMAAETQAFSRGLCTERPPMSETPVASSWNGWGPDVRNTRYQADTGGLNAEDVPRLTLKWAFGIPGATQSRAQPAVIGARLFMASQPGQVYALDAASGCTYWAFEAQAGVRSAISVGAIERDGVRIPTIYFADSKATAYGLEAETGTLLWARKLDDHPAAAATGSPTLHDGRLYVPTAGVAEETSASNPNYECCTFRGSVTALDAATGEVAWKTYTLPEPKPRGKSETGAQLWGPAGVSIWSAPTIDAKRGVLYVGTGNAFADPPQPTSNAVLAMDLETGALRWSQQLTPGDVWILGCDPQTSGGNPKAGASPNCPKDVGPDFDIAASPALVSAGGRDYLIVTQKSGVGYGLDPDDRGKVLWQYHWGHGSPIGGVWGTTSDGVNVYFSVADNLTPAPGGMHAADLPTGRRVWYAPPVEPLCDTSVPGCSAAQSAALTAIPGVVFSGSADGGMRAYAAETGEIIWTYDTNRSFETVNGVPATGGSIDGPGPVVAGGMLYITAGSGGFVGRPGNVLLAFGVEN